MRVIVTGSRYWTNHVPIWKALAELYKVTNHLIVVHGDSRDRKGNRTGADGLADEWCFNSIRLGLNVTCERWPADWAKYRKAAGPIRNQEMVKAGVWCEQCGVDGKVLAFPLGVSRGTRGCMEFAEAAGLVVDNRGDQLPRGLIHG